MKQIIIADDDPGIRDVFDILFKRHGYNATIYANAELLMHNDFELPDLFIIDKQLSGVDGLELCRFLKAQESTRDIPVIIISASPFISTLAMDAGADEFLEKPFRVKELLSIVQKHILNINSL